MEDKFRSKATPQGATAIITHRVKEGACDGYEKWLTEIGPIARDAEGVLDWQIIRPIKGVTGTYSVVIRFDSQSHLEKWMNSTKRKELIEEVRPLLVGDDDFFIRTGLDFWFMPEGARANIPVRWKQFVATWSAIYPLSLIVPMFLLPIFRSIGLPENRYLDAVLISGGLVFLMVYIVMPPYTKILQRWLFR